MCRHTWDLDYKLSHRFLRVLVCLNCGKNKYPKEFGYEIARKRWIKLLRQKYVVERYNPFRDEIGDLVWPFDDRGIERFFFD